MFVLIKDINLYVFFLFKINILKFLKSMSIKLLHKILRFWIET